MGYLCTAGTSRRVSSRFSSPRTTTFAYEASAGSIGAMTVTAEVTVTGNCPYCHVPLSLEMSRLGGYLISPFARTTRLAWFRLALSLFLFFASLFSFLSDLSTTIFAAAMKVCPVADVDDDGRLSITLFL